MDSENYYFTGIENEYANLTIKINQNQTEQLWDKNCHYFPRKENLGKWAIMFCT